jgi:hypothetical protein
LISVFLDSSFELALSLSLDFLTFLSLSTSFFSVDFSVVMSVGLPIFLPTLTVTLLLLLCTHQLMGDVEKYVLDLRDDENAPEFWAVVQAPLQSTSLTVSTGNQARSTALFRCGFTGDGETCVVRLPRVIQSALEDVEAYLLETASTLFVRMPLDPSDKVISLMDDLSTVGTLVLCGFVGLCVCLLDGLYECCCRCVVVVVVFIRVFVCV